MRAQRRVGTRRSSHTPTKHAFTPKSASQTWFAKKKAKANSKSLLRRLKLCVRFFAVHQNGCAAISYDDGDFEESVKARHIRFALTERETHTIYMYIYSKCALSHIYYVCVCVCVRVCVLETLTGPTLATQVVTHVSAWGRLLTEDDSAGKEEVREDALDILRRQKRERRRARKKLKAQSRDSTRGGSLGEGMGGGGAADDGCETGGGSIAKKYKAKKKKFRARDRVGMYTYSRSLNTEP